MSEIRVLTLQDQINLLEARVEADRKHLEELKATRDRLLRDSKPTAAHDAEIRDTENPQR